MTAMVQSQVIGAVLACRKGDSLRVIVTDLTSTKPIPISSKSWFRSGDMATLSSIQNRLWLSDYHCTPMILIRR
jgi:hypothetical protein